MIRFNPPSAELYFSKNDKNDRRLGEIARESWPEDRVPQPEDRVVAIQGYADDEGIRLNGGRVGAAEAPDRIRRYLYKMTPSLQAAQVDRVFIRDLGNLHDVKSETSIAERHEAAEAQVSASLYSGLRALNFGGGHDYGYPDGAAFVAYCQRKKVRPLILNFDAHLDVRPTDQGFTSGTPFFRLLEAFPDVDFAEIGIQEQCNSRQHFAWAQARGARVLTHDEFIFSGQDLTSFVVQRLEDWLVRPRPVFLSIDIDGFSNAYAPGCSQAWATGFEPESFIRLFHILLKRLDVRVVGLYEVSPPLDLDDRTAKLAALLAHRFLFPK